MKNPFSDNLYMLVMMICATLTFYVFPSITIAAFKDAPRPELYGMIFGFLVSYFIWIGARNGVIKED